MLKRNIVAVLYFVSSLFFLLGNEVLCLDYESDSKFYTNNSVSSDVQIGIEDLKAISVYSGEQVSNLISKWPSVENRLSDKNGDYHCFYLPDETVTVNKMKLTKALFYRGKDNWYLSGICMYINLDDEYRKTHTYLEEDKVSSVFDENGNLYLLLDTRKKIRIYKTENIELGRGVYYYGRILYKNRSNEINSYHLKTGKLINVLTLPLDDTLIFCYGENIKNPISFEDLRLAKLDEEVFINPKGVVFRNNRVEKGWDGTHIYNTIYLLDYDSHGNRKKGVYKLMGDKYEFYPDL